jgi:hypothetical protein
MSVTDLAQVVHQHVFAIPETAVYAILDGASMPDLPQMLAQRGVEAECLFRGELEPDMAQVAPYLVALSSEDPFIEWLLKEGWGKHWGIFAVSQANLRALRMHLRTFLKVYSPDLKPLYFRYYDPRVLRAYLPTCNGEDLRTVFGPVLRYVMEGEDATTVLKFWTEGEQLKSELAQLV